MKKIVFTLLTTWTFFGSALFAQDQTYVNERCQSYCQPNWEFEAYFTALIMQPMASNLDYAAQANPLDYGDAQPAVSPNWVIHEISTDYHFGFDIGTVGYFCNGQSNWALNWVRYHSPNDTASYTVSSNAMIGPFFEIGPDASLYKQATSYTNFDFDEVNLDYGSRFCHFDGKLRTNFQAGVSFMRILQNLNTTFANASNDPVRTINVPAKFTGAGPQLAFDFSYRRWGCLEFQGALRTSLLVGSLYNQTNYSTSSTTLVTLGDANPNLQSTTVDNRTGLVPGFETNLGLAYDLSFFNCFKLQIAAGYRAQVYLNALRSIDMGSEVALGDIGSIGSQETGVYARTFDRTISDFALAGPYVTVALTF